MATTAANVYSKIVGGKMLARRKLLAKMNSAFDIDFSAATGAAVAQLWDTWTTAVPAAGTLATHKANNQLYTLTLTSAETTMQVLPHQRHASFASPEALLTGKEQAADALLAAMQLQAVTSFQAATAGLSTALTANWNNFVIPASATTPDMINEDIAKVQISIEYVRANTDANDEDMYIMVSPTGKARLKALAGAAVTARLPVGQLLGKSASGRDTWDGVEIFAIPNGTNFGDATTLHEVFFVAEKRAFALKFPDPYVYGDGWVPGPDIVDRWTLVVPYAYGITETEFFAELTNP